ncbi:hypothetical protein N665_3690s0001 [Sinapis alba]|nr:hypothetical protein N665_3690s0001 [Sinapis alba]
MEKLKETQRGVFSYDSSSGEGLPDVGFSNRFVCHIGYFSAPRAAVVPGRSAAMVSSNGDPFSSVPTFSTAESVQYLRESLEILVEGILLLLKEYGIPWLPPAGYLRMYEAFLKECYLWFPLPSILCEYCARQGIAISQLTLSAVHTIVGFLVILWELGRGKGPLLIEATTTFRPASRKPGRLNLDAIPRIISTSTH